MKIIKVLSIVIFISFLVTLGLRPIDYKSFIDSNTVVKEYETYLPYEVSMQLQQNGNYLVTTPTNVFIVKSNLVKLVDDLPGVRFIYKSDVPLSVEEALLQEKVIKVKIGYEAEQLYVE